MWSAAMRLIRQAILGPAVALLATAGAEPAGAMGLREARQIEIVETRPVGPPLMAVVSLSKQRITIYDADGWTLRAPVSSGQAGYDTPAGIYSVIQKEEEHYSNRYDDAYMPFMQRITWSGIALHAGPLPGYPASHGCIRMPYEFAQGLFDITKIGMRVIVARNDLRPFEINHPALFQPKPVRADISIEALSAHWDFARTQLQVVTPGAAAPGADVPSPANEAEPLVTLRSIAAAKVAQANAAASKANAAWLSAARMSGDAARLLHAVEVPKRRAAAQLAAAEKALKAASSPEAVQAAEDTNAKALAVLAEVEAQLAAAKAEVQPKADTAARAREEAKAAEAEKAAALEASDEIERLMLPVSIFISRKTQRLYIRQAFQQVLESPVTIRDADDPIGTHIYTAVGYTNGGAELRWDAISMERTSDARQLGPNRKARDRDGYNAEPVSPHGGSAGAALDRIDIPQDIIGRISEVISPGSSLIISDEGMSTETGKDTDFVILMSGEPQGGIKKRSHDPEAHYRYDRPYDRSYGRSPVYAPWFYPSGSIDRW
jgi:L,D-transpeptidase catalytic domain